VPVLRQPKGAGLRQIQIGASTHRWQFRIALTAPLARHAARQTLATAADPPLTELAGGL